MALFRPDYLPKAKLPSGFRAVPVEGFDGLDLSRDPQEVGWQGAVDVLNVDLDRRGRLRSRDGSATVYTEASPDTGNFGLASYAGATLVVAMFGDPCLRAVSTAGTSLATYVPAGGVAGPDWSFAHVGTPAATYLYCCESSQELAVYDGSTFALAGGATYTPTCIGIQPNDNRLVLGTNSRVRFSNAGAPETFTADDYVDVTPGDGEQVRNIVSWQNLTFAFKQSKFFVFYGNSTDSTGGTVFNYRTVDSGIGAEDVGGVVAGPDGVYIFAQDGVYVTTGGPPKRASRKLDALFGLGSAPYWQGSTTRASQPRMAWYRGRLHCTLMATGTFVWEPETDTWTSWSMTSRGLTVIDDVLYFADDSDRICKIDSSVATDLGAAMTSRYRAGFGDLGTPGAEKVVREWMVEGYGAPTLKVAVNDGSLDAGAAVTLGTSPAVDQGRRRAAVKGRNFSWQLGATTAWSANRLVAHTLGERPAGLTSG